MEDTQERVLITRRSEALRSFPGCWVLPGGHWEAGETLEATAAREVRCKARGGDVRGRVWSEADVAVAALWVRDGGAQVLEETGLSLAEEDLTPLAMWESNYPIHIDVRAPWLPCSCVHERVCPAVHGA